MSSKKPYDTLSFGVINAVHNFAYFRDTVSILLAQYSPTYIPLETSGYRWSVFGHNLHSSATLIACVCGSTGLCYVGLGVDR